MMTDSLRRVVGESWGYADEAPPERDPMAGLRIVARRDGARPEPGRLDRTVRTEIIPRLLLARRVVAPPAADAGPAPVPEDVTELARLALGRDATAAAAHVEALHVRGAPVETLYLNLLAPTARHLGDLWQDDRCSFTDVTMALGRLQRVLHGFGPAFQGEIDQRERGRRILLVPAAGEQHSFGLSMVAEFFRRAGWDVLSGPATSRDDLIGLVRREWFAVIGLSASCATGFDALAAGIRAIRRASYNRDVGVLVGGPIFVDHPELARRVGADATAADGRQATLQAQNLLDLLPHSR